ncbi:MAG: fibronectin type III domain-containing protein [bacterium]
MDIPDFQPQQQNNNTAPILNQDKSSKLKKYLPIGIGTLISIVILVLAFGVIQKFFTRASGEAPQNVVTSEITENQAKITWSTNIETLGRVNYGTSTNSLNFPIGETEQLKEHSVDLTLLSPGTTYYYNIDIGGTVYDNGGIPWTFTTKEVQKTQAPIPTIQEKTEEPIPIAEPTVREERTCNETDCDAIKSKLGKGCTTQDYFKCVKALTPTPAE